jgi:hypothetical protein
VPKGPPAGAFTTLPVASVPSVKGSGWRICYLPQVISRSRNETLAARTPISSSPSGSGDLGQLDGARAVLGDHSNARVDLLAPGARRAAAGMTVYPWIFVQPGSVK